MTTMDQIHHIRELFYSQGKNISEIAKETGLNWKTVQKYVDKQDFNLPKPETPKASVSKLDQYKEVIDYWLTEDRKAPRKQRHTARRVYQRLKEEYPSFPCSYRTVAEYVAAKKKELYAGKTTGYIPLNHSPGEAQGDFGSADFYENGRHWSGKYFVMDFPHSNGGFIQLNYGENMECLLESMKNIFEHIGGVPTEIWFDNTTTIVTEVIFGGSRILNERFAHFAEHYGFKAVFMNPASGWEKGAVENKVGYSRHNLLVPVPRFMSLEDYNRQLLTECEKDMNRDHYLYDQTIAERYETDKAAFLPLPAVPFDTARYMTVRTDKCGRFTLHKGLHLYSASPAHAEPDSIQLRITSSTVEVMDMNLRPIVEHRRLYGDNKQQSMEWIPYLKYVALRPRSFRNSGVRDLLPESVRFYIDRCSNTDRGKVLKILTELTERTGFDSAVQTVRQAVHYNATDPDSLKNLYNSLYSNIPVLAPLKPRDGIPQLAQMPANLTAYDNFLEKEEAVNG